MSGSKNKKLLVIIAGIFLVLGVILFFSYSSIFGAPQSEGVAERFVVPIEASRGDALRKLAEEGFIKHVWAFGLIHLAAIEPGGYKLEKDWNAFQVSRSLKAEPYMKWVKVREGLRKEQIAELMQETLGWNDAQAKQFLTKDTELTLNTKEGVYFPDTYLIPIDESTADVAKRLNTRFNEVFAPYAEEALKQNIRWPTVMKMASLIERESGGKKDMALIAGILWNRLEIGMKLQVDATLQYIKGNTRDGWWATVVPSDKNLISPYNTYLHTGLPPHPIANPGIDAIEAVLYPEETKCLFYLHDGSGDIHCGVTYEEHVENVDKYLK